MTVFALKRGTRDTRDVPPLSFQFLSFSGSFRQIWSNDRFIPRAKGWVAQVWKILDPPLLIERRCGWKAQNQSTASPVEVFVNRTNRHVLTVSDFQILIKSCSIESRNDPSPKSKVVYETKFSLKISYSTHACLAQLDQQQT